MVKQRISLRFSVITLIILLAAISRLLPHPPNFAPIAAMALFGAAYYSNRIVAFVIPLFSMWISDFLINNLIYGAYFDGIVWFYSGSLFTYGAFALIVVLGMYSLKAVRLHRLALSAVGASAIFFLVSNFGVWFSTGMYPSTLAGLISCYVAGIPFLTNTLIGDLVFTGMLFGSFEICQWRFPILKASLS